MSSRRIGSRRRMTSKMASARWKSVGQVVNVDKYMEKAGLVIAYHEDGTALLPASS